MPRVQEGGLEAECSPKQVTLGECRCLHVDWNAYGALLAEALRAVEKLVPAVALGVVVIASQTESWLRKPRCAPEDVCFALLHLNRPHEDRCA